MRPGATSALRWKRILETVLPILAALAAVRVKHVVHQMGGSSVSTLLLAMVVIALLIPQLRRYVLVLICFGVCVFSLDRMWGGVQTVNWSEAVWTDYAFVMMWFGIAFFSGLAGVGEVWFDGARWSQQSYLLAVALYFIGHGGSEWLQSKRMYAVFLLLVGFVAMGGVLWIGAYRKPSVEPSRPSSRRRVQWTHSHSSPENPPRGNH